MGPKIAFSNVSKSFNLYQKQSDKLMEIISFKNSEDSFFALKNLSFEIYEGEAIGIVGLNGSGKSTLSNLLGQVIPPTSGKIEVNGETSIIAIAAGLNNQLTGLENINLKCLMHGLSKSEIQKLKSDIIEFADIGKFINQPVKNYSSGMKSRLGFAISIHTNPDILIIDEALSVGDQTFYQKCLDKMNEFKSKGNTIVFISHSISQVQAFCDRVMWIHFGRMEKFDEAHVVIKEYSEFIKWFNALSESEKKEYRAKMLGRQYKDEDPVVDNPSGRQAKLKKKKQVKSNSNFLFSLQFILLFLTVIISASFMFGVQPVKGIERYLDDYLIKDPIPAEKTKKVSEEKTKAKQQETRVKEVNKDGLVITGPSDLYSEYELKTPSEPLKFAQKLRILDQKGKSYKVRTNNDTIGYTNVENIKKLEEDIPFTQKEIEEFLPLFPERFANAYEYFLTFLNSDYEEVKTKLIGSDDEKIFDNGMKTLTYSVYSAQFSINQENKAESIIISNIDTTKEQWDQLKESASLISNDSLYYYFKTKKYEIVVDLENNSATVSLN
ncbi:ATP-binding cassette domain-containing protein [Bacillus sp. X1(2014)]|uniref:ATP-binding cassette domain-containing protein n=1 Tax=Bacillus sp. X1(2014) TaxID=1565991 RepID=UPI0011A8898C|nr:ATP-binding cassette domain-containing protein [Bacillus sp. X1(2014)]